MKTTVYIAAFTQSGIRLARTLQAGLCDGDQSAIIFAPTRFKEEGVLAMESLGSWTRAAFEEADALVFVSATGIAVRAIAPLLKDKMHDPAVVSIDEAGSFAIPLASGHVGGANQLARKIARICNGIAAISTATDVNGLFAVDEWAARNGLAIIERSLAKKVSACLLEGKHVGFASDIPIEGTAPTELDAAAGNPCEIGIMVSADVTKSPFAETLHLVPAIIAIGAGCRMGANPKALRDSVEATLAELGVPSQTVSLIASIDVKSEEKAILSIARERKWDLRFYSAAQLNEVEGEFEESEFVRKTVGVGNVCERAAMKAVEETIRECAIASTPQLIAKKKASNGTTVALACAMPKLAFPSDSNETNTRQEQR